MPIRDQNYQYTDREVRLLVDGRIDKMLRMHRRRPDGIARILVVSEDAVHSRFLRALAEEQSNASDNNAREVFIQYNNSLQWVGVHLKNAREILIPYKIGFHHWVGVHIKIDINGKITKAVFLSALAEDAASSSKELEERALKIIEAALLHVHDYKNGLVKKSFCKQACAQDSIVFVIANLSYSYFDAGPTNPPTSKGLRVDYNSTLSLKQGTVEITVKAVSEDVKDLITTLKDLNRKINGYAANNGYFLEPTEQIEDLALLDSQYTIVYNQSSKRIELQLDRMYDDEHVANFTRRMPLHTTMPRAAARYIKSAGVGAIGGGLAGLAGGVAFASVESMAGGVVNLGRAALLLENPGVFFFSPAFLAPLAAGVVAGGVYEYTNEQARIFGRTTKEAYTAYRDANKGEQVLDDAAKKLEIQLGLGVDGKWRLSNSLRNMHLHDSQIKFAKVLLAKIYAKQGNRECFSMFKKLIDKHPGTEFEAMCLVGLIDMYSDRVRWKLSDFGVAMPEAKRSEELAVSIDKLNKNHHQFINCYFACVMNAYAQIFEILTTASFMEEPEKFEAHRERLMQLSAMPNLHCMRFMKMRGRESEPVGKVAEVVFAFAQGITAVMFAEHVKYQHIAHGTRISVNSAEYDAISSAVTNAFDSLTICRNLIKKFKLDGQSNSNRYDHIISVIKQYIARYEARNKNYLVYEDDEQNNREADSSVDLQTNLSELEKEQAVDHLFRQDPDVSHAKKNMAHSLLFG